MKKQRLFAITLSLLAIGFVGCEKKLKNDKDKASYAIGQQIGSNLKSQNIEIDADVLAQSIKDVSAGKPSKMTPEEQQQAMMKLQESLVKKQQEEAEKSKTEGAAFLEKNKANPDVKTTASGLQYQIVSEGKGKSPTVEDTVKAHYTGTLINGEKFDSSHDRGQPAEFPVGGVIKGWTEALQMMKPGGKMKLWIPADLAYGPSARPGIPANSVLLFDVELVEILPRKK
ncbi:MAG: FKBP-type peptidyl-prolyl cis-trans isomerase [Proteobacteria bacterium]|jgi:FKBP-type peptidyl-prolyl cis-trans isomerase FkpA/FKBP-type peptidyl-prolyl cis-trans isomerase FklB|nr:FKBP-type peptidyl-prolyl cis-trans isomerase [Pseudomonadota bacterium]